MRVELRTIHRGEAVVAAIKKAAKSTVADSAKHSGFTEDERAAMKERGQEVKASAKRSPKSAKADGLTDVLAKIADMEDRDRAMAERVHAIVMAAAPDLTARLWYGMPAYAKDGSIICFFQDAKKFKTRYATLGFSDKANLDDGDMWPSSYALNEVTAAVEKKISALVKTAAS
jgi:uncharacterized protein YdhG (YjbR/CyaY superfamily)